MAGLCTAAFSVGPQQPRGHVCAPILGAGCPLLSREHRPTVQGSCFAAGCPGLSLWVAPGETKLVAWFFYRNELFFFFFLFFFLDFCWPSEGRADGTSCIPSSLPASGSRHGRGFAPADPFHWAICWLDASLRSQSWGQGASAIPPGAIPGCASLVLSHLLHHDCCHAYRASPPPHHHHPCGQGARGGRRWHAAVLRGVGGSLLGKEAG